jgi:UDP-3-O-[3-hydroxymyristoyl] glucosamine N-acyltransferase
MLKEIKVDELVSAIGLPYKLYGSMNRKVRYPAPIYNAQTDSLSFCSSKGEAALEMIRTSKAGIIIFSKETEPTKQDYQDRTLIQVANPRLVFIELLQKFFTAPRTYGIHLTAIIDPKAKIADRVYIGPYSCIGECEIGEETIIEGNVYIYSNVRIGKRVIIYPGAVIGCDGYGFERNKDGVLERFPQIGGVVINNDVEIGSCTVVDRGAMGDTIIGEGTKIDNLCHIAHGVIIGKHCMVMASTMIAGSTKIGDYAHIAPSASFMNKIEVGRNTLVGLGSVVIGNIPDNSVVAGVPAKKIRDNI